MVAYLFLYEIWGLQIREVVGACWKMHIAPLSDILASTTDISQPHLVTIHGLRQRKISIIVTELQKSFMLSICKRQQDITQASPFNIGLTVDCSIQLKCE